jgi:hypothetical protein
MAFDDGTTRVLLTICDVRMIGRPVCDEAKKLVTQRTGVPASHLLVAATHTHGTPTPVDIFDDPRYVSWRKTVVQGIAASMTQAVSNLAPARLGHASTRKPGYLFNRRWKLKPGFPMPANPFGETTDGVLTNPGARMRDSLLEPAGPVDDELSVLSVQHADGRPLGLLANYSTHYVGGYADQLVSSDYFGVFADQVKQMLAPKDAGFEAMLFNGTSGDVNTIDFTAPLDRSPPWTRIARIGEDMARTAVDAIKPIDYRTDIKLAAAVAELELGVRKPDAKRIAWAKAIAPDGKRPPGRTGMYAAEALELAKYPDRVTIPLQAMRIGDVAIAAMPCEVFAETGLEIKRDSPVKPTINISLANGYYGYLPTPAQHALGGYETWAARSTFLEVDASTKIRDTALKLLADVRP